MPQPKSIPLAEAPLPLPKLLWRARQAVASCYRANLRKYSLTDQQWRVLRGLVVVQYEDISKLATRTDILPPSLSRILRDLADRKLLVRSVPKDDARRVVARLTPAGRRLVDKVTGDVRPITIEIEQHLGPVKISELREILGGLIAWVEQRSAVEEDSSVE